MREWASLVMSTIAFTRLVCLLAGVLNVELARECLLMARDKRSINFYADLNKLSTADLLDGVGPKKKKRKTLKGVFTAERLVAVKNVKVRISNDCHDKPS